MSGRSVHTIKVEVEVRVIPAGLADFERVYPTLEIEFSYLPGAPREIGS